MNVRSLSGPSRGPVLTMAAAAAAAAIVCAAPVSAAHIDGGTFAEARGSAGTRDTNSFVWLRSGQYLEAGGSFDGGPLVAGATEVWASTAAALAGSAGGSFSSASLERGELKTLSEVVSLPLLSASGQASAQISDSIFFTNTSDGLLPLTLTMGVDGSFAGNLTRTDLRSRIFLGTTPAGCNGMGGCITPLSDGTGAIQTELLGEYRLDSQFQFREFLSGQINENIDHWTLGIQPGHDGFGQFDYFKSITLFVPTGETTLNLQAELGIFCIGTGLCDFGNTAALRFGALPDGLSFTSQSGVFLSGLSGPAPGVPEPASWAMLIAGFGLVGARLRRRRAALA